MDFHETILADLGGWYLTTKLLKITIIWLNQSAGSCVYNK